MKLHARKPEQGRDDAIGRGERERDASPASAAAWALTPSALIPFGSFVPPPRSRRSGPRRDERR